MNSNTNFLYDLLEINPSKKYIDDLHIIFNFMTHNNLNELNDRDNSDAHNYLFVKYIDEIWISECNSDKYDSTNHDKFVEYVMEIFEKIYMKKFNYDKCISLNSDKYLIEICNLMNVSHELFGEKFNKKNNCKITIDLIKEVNKTILNNISSNNGQFRKKFVMAKGTSIIYCPPESIERRLKVLINFVNFELNSNSSDFDTFLNNIKIISIFFVEFLRIHPFIDGNGRCARILFNYLLSNFFIIPISIYSSTREYYINLMQSVYDCNIKHISIQKFYNEVIKCCMITLSTYKYLIE